jgi:hypothetical protein
LGFSLLLKLGRVERGVGGVSGVTKILYFGWERDVGIMDPRKEMRLHAAEGEGVEGRDEQEERNA